MKPNQKFHYANQDELFSKIAELHGIEFHKCDFNFESHDLKNEHIVVAERITEDYSIRMAAIYDNEYNLSSAHYFFRLFKE